MANVHLIDLLLGRQREPWPESTSLDAFEAGLVAGPKDSLAAIGKSVVAQKQRSLRGLTDGRSGCEARQVDGLAEKHDLHALGERRRAPGEPVV